MKDKYNDKSIRSQYFTQIKLIDEMNGNTNIQEKHELLHELAIIQVKLIQLGVNYDRFIIKNNSHSNCFIIDCAFCK